MNFRSLLVSENWRCHRLKTDTSGFGGSSQSDPPAFVCTEEEDVILEESVVGCNKFHKLSLKVEYEKDTFP